MQEILQKVIPQGRFWNDAWSLVDGCTPISPGCQNCWLAGIESRFRGDNTPNPLVKNGVFIGKVFERHDRLEIPFHKSKPRVFAVWSDLFHKDITLLFVNDALKIIESTPQHYFLFITKRPEGARFVLKTLDAIPLSNVFILVTMENQDMVEKRSLPALKLTQMGWKVGLLCEPLLERIYIPFILREKLSWVICGPETGPSKRPFNEDWAAYLQDQCKEYNIPFMLKKGTIEGVEYKEVPK